MHGGGPSVCGGADRHGSRSRDGGGRVAARCVFFIIGLFAGSLFGLVASFASLHEAKLAVQVAMNTTGASQSAIQAAFQALDLAPQFECVDFLVGHSSFVALPPGSLDSSFSQEVPGPQHFHMCSDDESVSSAALSIASLSTDVSDDAVSAELVAKQKSSRATAALWREDVIDNGEHPF